MDQTSSSPVSSIIQLNHLTSIRTGSPLSSAEKSYLSSSPPTSLCIPYLPGPKSNRGVETYHRLKQSKPPHRSSQISYDESPHSCASHSSTSLGSHLRSTRCLFAHTNSKVPSQVSSIHLQEPVVFLSCPSIRAQCSSKYIHKSDALSSLLVTPPISECRSISRRLANLGHLRRENKGVSREGSSTSSIPRSHSKLAKIQTRTTTRTNLARNSLVNQGGNLEYPFRKASIIEKQDSSTTKSSVRHQERMGASSGKPQLRLPSPPPPSASPAASSPSTTYSPALRERLDEAYPSLPYSSHESVAERRHTNVLSLFSPSKRNLKSLDRCLTYRLGRSYSAPPVCRHLDIQGEPTPHQLLRGASSVQGNSSFRLKACSHSLAHRQSGSTFCHKQKPLQVSAPAEGNQSPFSCSCRAFSRSQSLPHLLPIEHKSRCSKQRSPQSFRLVSTAGDFQRDSTVERQTGNRSNGKSGKQETSNIHISISRPQGSRAKCPMSGLEPMVPDIYISPQVVHTNDSSEIRSIQASRSIDTTVVPNRIMVSANPDEGSEVPPFESKRSNKEWTDCIRKMDRIRFLEACLTSQHDEEIASHITKAYRASTSKQAQSVWKTFQSWLPPEVSEITEDTVMHFLIFLRKEKKLSPQTVLNYRSTLAWPLKLALKLNLSSENFSLLARSQFLEAPPTSRKIPTWSIDLVLETFSKEEYSLHKAPLEKLLLKTLFLTAIASGNRASELAATTREGVIVSNGQITLPVQKAFLFKNQSIAHQTPPAITIPKLDQNKNLCPAAHILRLIQASKHVHNEGFIFVNPTSFKPLKAGRLSYWLVKAIKVGDNCASKPKGHDTRKMGHSIAFARGEDPTTIIKNGFWHSPNVFIHKYLISNVSKSNKQFVAGRTV